MSFVGEIRRRKVFQVAAVYAVVAWLLIQIVDVISEPLNLPDWFDTFAIVLFGIGFPIALILAWAFDLTPDGIEADSGARAAANVAPLPGHRLTLSIQAVVLLAVAFLVVDQFVLEPRSSANGFANTSAYFRPSSGVRRYEINLGETVPLGNTGLSAEIAVSPDGEHLAYVIGREAGAGLALHLRSLDRLDAEQLSIGRRPFFSDDGQRLGLLGGPTSGSVAPGMGMGMGSTMRTFSVQGGPPQFHLETETGRQYGGSWHGDTIVWSKAPPGELAGGNLYRLSTTSDETELLLASEPGKALVQPEFLPGGEAVLFTIRDVDGNAREGSVAVLSLETGEHHELIEDAYGARYAPTGHLVFARSGALWAVAFDPETLEVSGAQTPVVDGVQMDGTYGQASYGFSDVGLLVYVAGGDVGSIEDPEQPQIRRDLAMLGEDGSRIDLPMQPRAILDAEISPDSERAAIVIEEAGNRDIYILDDFTRAVPRRLTFDQGEDSHPIWTPDGERIVFWSSREGGGMFSKGANGVGQTERLTESAAFQRPLDITPDGSELIFVDNSSRDGSRPTGTLHRISINGEGIAEPLLGTGEPEVRAEFSPDGRWLAYAAGQWPQIQVYVVPYPNPSGSKWQVSASNTSWLMGWLNDDTLIYADLQPESGSRPTARRVMAVTLETEPVLQPGAPEEIWSEFRDRYRDSIGYMARFSDGRGFLAAFDVAETTTADAADTDATTEDTVAKNETRLIVVENWFEELEALASDSHLR
jgi:serine/threonine-protein kinase